MKIEYRRDLQHSYLVIHSLDEEGKETYPAKMITENVIPGLLSCEIKRMDHEILYYYDLTSKISLAERWRGGKAEGEEVISVIFTFLKVLENMEEYLLSADSIYLKLEQIYGDAGMEEIAFCYIPGEKWELEQQFRELLEEILPLLNHKNQKAVVDVYSLYHYVVQEGITAEGLREHMNGYRKEKNQDIEFYEEEGTEEREAEKREAEKREGYFEETKRKEQQRQWEQKRHEEALEAFFLEDDGEENETTSKWIGISAAGVFVYGLAGWLLWRNYPGLMVVWAVVGIILGVGAGILVKVRNRKKEAEEIDERFPGLEEEKNYSYKNSDREENFKEEEYMTKILGKESIVPGFRLEEKYPRQDRSILIGEQEVQFVGTLSERADIILPSEAVSRIHGRIRIEENVCYLRDLNSRNGTWINGKALEGDQEERLEEGDEIRFADMIYRFRR